MGQSVSQQTRSDIGTGLVVCNSESTFRIVKTSLQKVAISSECCSSAAECLKRVSRQKYEVIFVDFASADQPEIAVEHVRSSPSTRTAVVIAITANSVQSRVAYSVGAQFVVEQPIYASGVDSVLKAAYGLIIRERRRYFRCALDSEVIAHRNTESAWSGHILNISEGGLCIIPAVPLVSGEAVQVELHLPNTSIEVSVACQVQWTDISGRAGLRFVSMPAAIQSDLQHWLAQQLEATFLIPPSAIA